VGRDDSLLHLILNVIKLIIIFIVPHIRLETPSFN